MRFTGLVVRRMCCFSPGKQNIVQNVYNPRDKVRVHTVPESKGIFPSNVRRKRDALTPRRAFYPPGMHTYQGRRAPCRTHIELAVSTGNLRCEIVHRRLSAATGATDRRATEPCYPFATPRRSVWAFPGDPAYRRECSKPYASPVESPYVRFWMRNAGA